MSSRSTSVSRRPHVSRSRSLSPASTRSEASASAESVLLGFLESKFHELARRQEDLIRFQHELELREKALEVQAQQMTWLDGYQKGWRRGNSRGSFRGSARGRGRGRGNNKPAFLEDGQISEASAAQQ